MKRVATLVITFAVVAGTVAGLLSSKPALALVASDLYMQPGGASSFMSCGWHGTSGCPNLDGYALDWSSAAGPGVWWRSYGIRIPSGGIGNGYPSDASTPNGGCTRIGVDIYTTLKWRGKVVYTHARMSNPPPTSFAIAGGSPTSPAFTSRSLGATIQSEGVNCPFTGQHLHQYNSTSGDGNIWYHNTNVYPYAPGTGNWDPYNWSYWQARTYWSE
jgi:hypothetical protein